MKIWLNEKRLEYIKKIIKMKIGPRENETTCTKCRIGQAVWRCLDCSNKNPTCVLCCRESHKQYLFHRIEKWNGRFYQKGALWQVGVKIFLGHNGEPCLRSTAALTGIGECIGGSQNENGYILEEVSAQFGISPTDVLEKISEALQHSTGSMTSVEREVLTASAAKAGLGVLDLLTVLTEAVSKHAEADAAALQSDSDEAAATAEAAGEKVTGDGVSVGCVLEDDIGGDEDDWEDEDDRPTKGDIPRFLPRPPPTDRCGNPFLTVVHVNGFHSLPVVWCSCAERINDQDQQLLEQYLYPASYDRIKTVFTFECLDDHRYEYLECKSSHYQYHNKLRRWTCPESPDAAPNRYKELCRVARQWRNLKYRKWFWLLHNEKGKRGEMALFCAACPQDGVNLGPGWEAEQEKNP
jgi:hypothetical protein